MRRHGLRVMAVGDMDGGPGILITGTMDEVRAAAGLLYAEVRLVRVRRDKSVEVEVLHDLLEVVLDEGTVPPHAEIATWPEKIRDEVETWASKMWFQKRNPQAELFSDPPPAILTLPAKVDLP